MPDSTPHGIQDAANPLNLDNTPHPTVDQRQETPQHQPRQPDTDPRANAGASATAPPTNLRPQQPSDDAHAAAASTAETETPTMLLSVAGTQGWIPLSVLWIDDTTAVHGRTNFSTFTTSHYAPPPNDNHRVRVCKYDTVTVTQFHIPEGSTATSDDAYAYVTIGSTHADERITGEHLRRGLRYLTETYNTAVQEALHHHRTTPWPSWAAASSPYVTPITRSDLHDIMMLAAQAGWTYIREARARVRRPKTTSRRLQGAQEVSKTPPRLPQTLRDTSKTPSN